MKICIIGTNGHIGYIIDALKKNKDLKLVGVACASVDDDHLTLKKIASKFSCRVYSNYMEMLEIEKPDVAGIATRYDLNSKVSLDCLNAGINCFTEKCIAHNFESLNSIKSSSRKNNRKIIGMHAMRYYPAFFAAYNSMQNGDIGRPMLITGQKSYKFGDCRPEFYKERKKYGGTILWVASHAIDWTYWMLGDLSQISAFQTTENNFDYEECESCAVISMKFKNGALGTINTDFYQPMQSLVHGDDQVRIAGEKGIIQVRYGKAFLTTHKNKEKELPLIDGDFFSDYCDELKGEGKCRLTMEDTFAVTKLCLFARKSADDNGVMINI